MLDTHSIKIRISLSFNRALRKIDNMVLPKDNYREKTFCALRELNPAGIGGNGNEVSINEEFCT